MKSNTVSRRRFLQLAGISAAGGLIAACGPAAPAAAPAAEQPTAEEGAATEAPQEAPAASTGGTEFILWGLEYDPT
jgi:hypothetical protein